MQHYQLAARAKCGAACLFLTGVIFAGVVCAAGCGGGGILRGSALHYVRINPSKTAVPAGQTRFFRADAVERKAYRFKWEVKEGDAGGTLLRREAAFTDYSENQYTAPQKSGTYHVKVTLTYQDGDSASATATIDVP